LVQLDEALGELHTNKERLRTCEAEIKVLITELEQERGKKDVLERSLRDSSQGEEDAKAEAAQLSKR
jgi:hypothetical protein